RIGTLTLCNSFRNPALIAKMAASLDVISNGRLLFGIGAGWKEHEYDAYGYPFPSGKIRLDQLEEAVQIIKRLWTEREATFKGKHYQIDSAFCSPKPIQKPHPPILVGGHGEKRTLKIVAEHADMCNFTFQVGQELDRLLDKLRGHCKKAGRDYDSVRKTFFALCMISEDQGEVDALIARGAESRGISFEENRKRLSDLPGAWIGTPEAVREKCEYLIQKGFSLFQIRFDFQREVDMARVFSKSVMSKV
ncbi:MAG: LLM class flavin-dependent oxidoreductase, partial [Candidatus Thorarchaeota archaeon]